MFMQSAQNLYKDITKYNKGFGETVSIKTKHFVLQMQARYKKKESQICMTHGWKWNLMINIYH